MRAIASALAAAMWLIACGDSAPADSEGGRDLLARVRAESYRNWERAPGWPSRLPSRGGHGGQVDIYVNQALAAVLQHGQSVTEWPQGSTIVKDVWNGTELRSIAIMDKRADGWYWAEFNGAGAVSAAGQPEGCTTCHQSGVDYVRAFGSKSE